MGATKPGAGFWPGPIIPFEIDANFDNPDRILTAIRDHWEARTSIRFVRRAGQKDFILFHNGRQCSSNVGHQGGKQIVFCRPLDRPAQFGVGVIHEIGHAVGLIHEHQRSDRDTFVQVQQANIERDEEHNFARIDDSINLTDYDLRSIMHYGTSPGRSPTLVPIDPNAEMNNSSTFTSLDLEAIHELYPHVGIVRRSDSGFEGAGRVSEIAIAHGSPSFKVVTAVRTVQGILSLILWRINELGGIRRVADSGDQAGKATSIAIDRGQLFVTACRAESGRLLLISWSTDDDKIDRQGDSGKAAGRASLIRILGLTDNLFVTACRATGGNLLLITWLVDGSFERLADSGTQAGEVSEISLIRVRQVGTSHQVATTVRAGDGHVLSIIWNIAEDGVISRLGDSDTQMGQGRLIESAIHPATRLLVVSCRTAKDTLKLITLSVSGSGAAVRRRGDSGDQAGRIQSNAVMARPTGVLSAVKAGNDRLLLIAWGIDADGRVTRLGDSTRDQAGEIGLVRLGTDTRRPDAPVVTCVQTETRDLKLITWDDQPEHGELV